MSQNHAGRAISGGHWLFGVLLVILIWSYWNTWREAATAWRTDQYSHGVLLPLAAAAILWGRRKGSRGDWLPDGPTERRYFLLASVLFLVSVACFWGASRLGHNVRPGDPGGLTWDTLTSALDHLAGLFYALGLVAVCILAVKSLLDTAWGKRQESSAKHAPSPGIGREVQDSRLKLPPEETRPIPPSGFSMLWRGTGLGLIVLAAIARAAFAYLGLEVPEMWTFPVAFIGAVILVTGDVGLRWAWPGMVMLFLAFPLPFTWERQILVPLQGVATQGGTYLLQCAGLEATNEGAHFIRLGEYQLGVVEQCSGLRMATVFVAIVILYLFITPGLPLWQIIVLLLSAVPIALLVNIARITVTGILYVYAGPDWAQRVFHDWAGYLMPLAAVVVLLLERWLLDKLFVLQEEAEVPLATRLSPAGGKGA